MLPITAKVIADSIYNGNRLITLELEYPRYIHAEFMTHRVFSRNAQSSRAIPVATMIKKVRDSEWYPIFMKNQKGMAAAEELSGVELTKAQHIWQMSKLEACKYAERYAELGVHKQVANRLLEPFSTIKVIVSATEWDNFFSLRISPAAQQEICILAWRIRAAMDCSTPVKVDVCNWHLPYIYESEQHLDLELIKKISVARCARVSYLNHDSQLDHAKDIELFNQLKTSRHLSPFEHVATPTSLNSYSNFKGWNQLRSFI